MSAVVVAGAVEGILDEAVLQRLLQTVSCELDPVHGKRGKPWLREKIRGFNAAAAHTPWVVLVDLDRDAACAAELVSSWLARPARQMHLRVAVRSVEAWLLADRERISAFLGVALTKIPLGPEQLDHPKQALINLARTSRRKDIRQDLVPRHESGRVEGPAYASRMIEFAADAERGWRPGTAVRHAPSLRRCLAALERIASGSVPGTRR